MNLLGRSFLCIAALTVAIFCPDDLMAQSSPASALSRIEKSNWIKAEQQLRKSLKKDTLNAEARYVYSLLYFSDGYPKKNIDSAYHYALASLSDFRKSSLRQKERMKRFPLDSFILVSLRKKIDSAAFERAKTINNIQSYQIFLDEFSFASQQDAAIELRDEVAFLGALRINTYSTFKDYVIQYPLSHRKEEAEKRYEKLLFEDKTRDGKLRSYQNFLKDYPLSIYRSDAEKIIFEISTASGEPEEFAHFISSYSASHARKKAEDILYHLQRGVEQVAVPMTLTDSLNTIRILEKGYWVPVLKNEKFGFMDENGKEIIAPRFDIIYDDYKCGEIRTDYLITSDGIFSRSEELIFRGLIEEVTELGLGFLKVQDSTCFHVIHKSGFKLNSHCIEDAKVVANRFISYKANNKWGLVALNGLNLLAAEFEDIYSLEQVIVLVKSGKKSLKTPEQIYALADKNTFSESIVVDEIRQLDPDTYLVKNGSLEGTINSHLDFIIPLDRQVLTRTPYGYVAEKNEKFRVIGIADELAGNQYDEIRFYENWLSLKNESGLHLFSIPDKMNLATELDSIWFLNKLAFCLKEDTLQVFLASGVNRKFLAQSDFQFIKSLVTELFFHTYERNLKHVYDAATGLKLFQLDFDEIEYLGGQVFAVTYKGKKGLVQMDGKSVLPVEYSQIVKAQENYVSLFKDKKFGLFDLKTRKLIKPLFESNVKPFRENIYVTSKDGLYGFIDADAKPIGKFEFDDIIEWNDSTALVKKNFQWMIYNWTSGKIAVDRIRDYRIVLNGPEEKILIAHQGTAYGVISNKHGIVIPCTFSDIINIGSTEDPLYFTEKNVEEAEIYVVIYYSKMGEQIRRQVFEKDEYEEIYCEER